MRHDGSRMLFLERIKELIKVTDQLKGIYREVQQKNDQIFEILDDIEQGIDAFSKA